jgi:YHS domain-containing protein
MLVFPDGRLAVAFGLAIKERRRRRATVPGAADRHPLRIGPLPRGRLRRDERHLAARVTATAKRHQFLITDTVVADIQGLNFEVGPVGAHSLKGISEPVELFSVHTPGETTAKTTDPVCGVELDDQAAEAELNRHGRRLQFCSDGCVRLFLDNPERYATAP